MENIEEIFKEKNFDEITLHYINIFIEEFSELFGKYVSREELVKRIKENLNHSFEFADLTDTIGTYDRKEKKITLKNSIKDDEDKIREVVFHEMIHCITARGRYTGFSKSYGVYGEDNVNVVTAHGLTEGFTQYLTQLRNERFNHKGLTSYPILAEQTINLAELLGKEVFINLGLNNPDGLYYEMQEHRLVENLMDYYMFLDAFDVIWKNEKDLFLRRGTNISDKALISRILYSKNYKKSDESKELEYAKKELVGVFLRNLQTVKVNSIEELEELYNKIEKYAVQIDGDRNFEIFGLFWKKLDEYISKGHSRKEVLAGFSKPLQLIVPERFYIEDFLNLSINEQLKVFKSGADKLTEIIFYSRFRADYLLMVINALFGPEIEDKEEFYFVLVFGFATEILENGYDVNKLSIEIINTSSNEGVTFNLYENSAEGIKYLSTYSRNNSESVISKYFVVTSQEEIDRILEQNPDIPQNAVIMKDKFGCIIAYSGDGRYILINDMEEKSEYYGMVRYVPSKLEREYKKLQLRIERYKRLEELNAPPIILENEKEQWVETYLTICRIEGRVSTNLEEIGEFVKGIKISEVEKMLEDYSNAIRDKNKAMEDGIGYRS